MTHSTGPDAESLRLELQQAIITIRQQYSLLTQIFGIIATADSILLAYGFTQRISSVILIASFMPIIMLISSVVIGSQTVPIIYVGVTLEQRLNLVDVPLVAMYVPGYVRGIFAADGQRTIMTESEIRKSILGISLRRFLTNRAAYILYVTFAIQVCLFLISLLVYNYRFM